VNRRQDSAAATEYSSLEYEGPIAVLGQAACARLAAFYRRDHAIGARERGRGPARYAATGAARRGARYAGAFPGVPPARRSAWTAES
jgi:hypothetical protein